MNHMTEFGVSIWLIAVLMTLMIASLALLADAAVRYYRLNKAERAAEALKVEKRRNKLRCAVYDHFGVHLK